MRIPAPSIRLSAWVALMMGGGFLAPSASADTIYVQQGVLPPPQPVPGWAAIGDKVTRKVPQPDGSEKDMPFFGIRGRIVDLTPITNDHLVHFQILMAKTSTMPRPGSDRRKATVEYGYHPAIVQIPSKQIREIEQDFDSLHDLRMFLGNDDIRLREYAVQDPRILDGTFKTLSRAEVVKRISGGGDTVYAFLGYGGVHARALMSYRLGLRGVSWNAMRDAPNTTRYDPGWLTYLLRSGIPKDAADRDRKVRSALARGEVLPAVARIPLLSTFELQPDPSNPNGPIPPDPNLGIPSVKGAPKGVPNGAPLPPRPISPAGPTQLPGEVLLGAEIRPILHQLLEGAARDAAYVGLVLSGDVDQTSGKRRKNPKPHYKDAVVKIMRELCSWSRIQDGARDTARQKGINERARAVGRVAREVTIECLEGASAGRKCAFDVLNRLPAGVTTASPERLLPQGYLPIDPSRVALIAMEVVQGPRQPVTGGTDRVAAPDWQQPDSEAEAKRLVKVLIRLARPRYAKDPEWKSDPRADDYGRRFMRKGETRLYQEAMLTLGGAARGGLLVATQFNNRFYPSPYLRYMVGLLNELEHRDRVVLMHAMTLAGVGDKSLYAVVVDRMFAICLDNEGWSSQASPQWIQRSRRDAVAGLGLLVSLEQRLEKTMAAEARGSAPAGGRSVRLGSGSVSQLIFAKLDTLLDAKNQKRASEQELKLLEMIKLMSTGQASSDVTAAWLPQVARSQDLARDLTNAYHKHVENAPTALQIEGSRRVERMKANVEESAAVTAEVERIRTEVENAKERYGQFPFPARPKGS